MSDFTTEIRQRVRDARDSITEALAAGDDYLVHVLQGELEGLTQLAREHQVVVE